MNVITTNALSVHEALIREICAEFPEVQTGGFFAALRNLPDAEYVPHIMTDKDWLKRARFTPDAWAINPQEREITIFEVVCSHDISVNKMERICDLAWAVDEDYWTLGLIRCTEYGRKAYDPQFLWTLAQHDNLDKPESERLRNWKKYTCEYTDGRYTRLTTRQGGENG